ncbi:MAG: hypothetical protein MJ137_06115 [Clostridia bacterium]|nr:hypothetical protein [Clostridia bacterium]
MFLIKKEVEKPNYAKIIGITLGIIAGVAAIGAAAYYFFKKRGLCCYFCKKADCEGCDYAEEILGDDAEAEEVEEAEDDTVEVEVEDAPEA